jgi:hypothetical protein
MPFRSIQQKKWMYANKPIIAERWSREFPNQKNLPKKVKKVKHKINPAVAGMVNFGTRSDPAKYPEGYFQELGDRIQANKQQIVRMGKMSTGSSMLKAAGDAVKFAANVKIPSALGYGAVIGAGYLGAKAITDASKKANREIKSYGEQTSKQQSDIIKGIKERRALKKKHKLYKTDNKMKWMGEYDTETGVIKVNKKRAKKAGAGKVAETIYHESLHKKYPKMSEKEVYKKEKNWKKLSKKSKSKLYAKCR